MPEKITVTLALSEAQAKEITHFWWWQRTMAEADKNPISEGEPPARDPSFLEYNWWASDGDLGEVIQLADGNFIYRYEGKRRTSFARPEYAWLMKFSLESLPVLEYEADDDPELTWYYPIAYDPKREAADRERERNRTFEVVDFETGERHLLKHEPIRGDLPKNVHLVEKVGTSGLQALDKRFPGWRERPPTPPTFSTESSPT